MDSQRWSSFDNEDPPKKQAPPPQAGAEDGDAATPPVARKLNWIDLRNRMIFGAMVGFTTGATFGAVDAARAIKKQTGVVGWSHRNALTKAASVGGGAFAGFFLGYQGIKTVLEAKRGTEDYVNVGVATLAAGLPFIRMRMMRQNVPYALMLVALDYFNVELSEVRR